MENEKKQKKRFDRKKFIIWAVVIIVMIVFCIYENEHLVVTNYAYVDEKIGKELENYRIVQLSDLHNKSFGKDNSRLLDMVYELDPNMVVITGDMIDGNHTDIDVALKLAKKLTDRYPTYYITGNHEYFVSDEDRMTLVNGLRDAGVVALDNEIVEINVEDEHFKLVGLDDNHLNDGTLDKLTGTISDDELIIVLAHEPDYFEKKYSKTDADVILAGHAHGGQFRLPFIGPVIAPGQGFNPQYAEGSFELNSTTMIVSRGLGNSIIPIRLFNDPEIVCVDLIGSDEKSE